MNIHEHQAKEILRNYGAPVSNGVVIFSREEINDKVSLLKKKAYVLKAQIHAGGRGKAGGIKLIKNTSELQNEAKKMMGKVLITHQTGPQGKKVRRLYIEEASDISRELYLSCLIDRQSAQIAFISSTAGGMDIEKVASETPQKIITNKFDLNNEISDEDISKIVLPFKLNEKQLVDANNLIKAIYKIIIEKDATLIEINPLIITASGKLLCLDAKMNFDDNAIYRRPEILKLRDLNEEDDAEIEASKHDLAYIKLNGSIGCMVNGAGLAMATMDIIKLYGKEPANFLDVGGGATPEKIVKAFRLITMDKKVKVILVNIFAGINRCDWVAEGIVQALEKIKIEVPLVIRLAGTNVEKGNKILRDSKLNYIEANTLEDAANKAVAALNK